MQSMSFRSKWTLDNISLTTEHSNDILNSLVLFSLTCWELKRNLKKNVIKDGNCVGGSITYDSPCKSSSVIWWHLLTKVLIFSSVTLLWLRPSFWTVGVRLLQIKAMASGLSWAKQKLISFSLSHLVTIFSIVCRLGWVSNKSKTCRVWEFWRRLSMMCGFLRRR